MAHPLFVALARSPLGRAGLASVSILTLAALAGGIIPMTCQAGAAFCAGEAPALAAPEHLVAEAMPEPAASAVAAVATAPEPDGADFIADTFAALAAGLEAAPAELTTRTVRTVGIGPDGTPVDAPDAPLAAPPPLVVAEASEAAVSAEPEAAVSAEPERAAPAAEPVEKAAPSSLAYAAGTGDIATVTGLGANVRSQPQMSGSEVLFALRGGAEVTIAAMQRGWARVVDDSGRSGWIYGKYLRRQ